jgi:hypothetical protein
VLGLGALCALCVARPQPVDASAGRPVPLRVNCPRIPARIPAGASQAVLEFCQWAGL